VRLVPTASAPDGALLAKDVFKDITGALPFLRRGVKLDGGYRSALLRAGVSRVYIEDDLGEGIEIVGAVSDGARTEAARKVTKAIDSGGAHLARGGRLRDELVEELHEIAEMIAKEVNSSADVARVFTDLTDSDQYLMQHSVDVCALGVLLGKRYLSEVGWRDVNGRHRHDVTESNLAKLGLGLLLHDIGKLAIPESILQKPGPLTPQEWAVMKTHPAVGEDALPYEMSFLVKAIVRHHHERWDGAGYPDAIPGARTHHFARIAAAADVFDAVTSDRVYRAADPTHVGWQVVVDGSGLAFDPEVVGIFRQVVVPYPPGTEVVLADGRTAVVSAVDLAAPLAPTVRVRTSAGIDELAGAEVAGTPGADATPGARAA
jgi:HD-GYP domain-containing protein (c-di-GMP phosphodiesterase class II)